MRRPHPIERESYRIPRSGVATAHLSPLTRAVVERIVHTTADPTWVGAEHHAPQTPHHHPDDPAHRHGHGHAGVHGE